MSNEAPTRQEYGQSTHTLTDEGKKEITRFVWIFVVLWISSFILRNLMDSGDITSDPWFELLINSLTRFFIAFSIITWVNNEVRFFKQTDWYKAKASERDDIGNYQLTEKGKETVKKFTKVGVLAYLIQYFSSRIFIKDLIDTDFKLIFILTGFPVMIFIVFSIIYYNDNKETIFKQKSKPRKNIRGQPQSPIQDNNDIFQSGSVKQENIAFSSKNQPAISFTSKKNVNPGVCKTCYGGLNDQGKCEQCDKKW